MAVTAAESRAEERRWPVIAAVVALAALAYVPALRSSPGRMPADTKVFLYLDPGRLIGDAPWTFDARQFAGWVPHQVIAYLWPQGPWFWLGERLALPDWVAHRLWIGTLLFAAGAGVLWAGRRLGLGLAGALAAALVYQLSPYILPYVSRTSAMLLPWAGLGWIVGLTALAATRHRWRYAALVALVVATVGAVNATALLMVAPAPALWLVVAARAGRITWRRAATTAARIGGLGLGVSLWWVVMVLVQGSHGAEVLAYSESLESVSFTSTSTEVWRGLGYWLTYVRDAYAATTTAAFDHMHWQLVIVASFALVLVGVAGLVVTRWRERSFAIVLVVTGVVLAVGVHPFDDPSPLMSVLVGDGTSGAALALRSSTRAVPMLLLGLALGTGALVEAVGRRAGPPWRVPVQAFGVAAVAVLAVANLPSLRFHRYVDPALDRDQSPPAAWLDAAAALDAGPPGYRVLQLPGQEFGAFRWGYTVDPPLPGLTDRPLVTRDLLPLGSPEAMDLLYALDDRFQAGIVEPASIAPVARLLGADTIWLTGDAAFDRFRTPRPELIHELFAGDGPGLGEPVPYGEPVVNRPDIAVVDEQAVGDETVGTPVPPVELVPVEAPEPVIRAKDESVVVVGSGDGIVDAAAAGLLDGHELVRYSAPLDAEQLAAAVADARRVIVTDSHRRRAHHWRSSQDVVGYTESPDGPEGGILGIDVADERLPVFGADPDVASQTVSMQDGPVRATATGYGERFAFRPEDRPVMAVDGDPATAWIVADRAPAVGHQLRLAIDAPIDHVTLRQPDGAAGQRHIARVVITVGDAAPITVALDARSLAGAGQRIAIPPTTGPVSMTIRITAVSVPDPAAIGPALAGVGFATVGVGLAPTVEVVVPPRDIYAAGLDATPTTFVFTRLRTRPTDRWRSDPEPRLVREVATGAERTFAPTVTVRLDRRAADGVLADLLGIDGGLATSRLTGVATAAGWAATDGDPETAWTTPFGEPSSTLAVTLDEPAGELELVQPAGDHSPITALRLSAEDGDAIDVPVPPPDASARSRVVLPAQLPAGPLAVAITGVEARVTIDRRFTEPVVLPAAIAELSIGRRTSVPPRVDTGCRDDLLAIDGRPVPLRVEAAVADLLAGEAVTATPCGGPTTLAAGTHRLTSTPGSDTGLHVDRVVLDPRAAPAGPAPGADPVVTVDSRTRTGRTVTVAGCPDGCWLVLGEGYHEQWSASTDAGDLGPPALVDGGFNGWWIAPSDAPTTVSLRWGAQAPLTVALLLSALAILACLAIVVLESPRARRLLRRAPPDVAASAHSAGAPPAPMRSALDPLGPTVPRRTAAVAGVGWAIAAGLVVAPAWALAGIAGGVVITLTRRPRLAGLVTFASLATIGTTVYVVVGRDRPFPDAGWPVRFEYLHELGLFAAVSLAVAAVPFRANPDSSARSRES